MAKRTNKTKTKEKKTPKGKKSRAKPTLGKSFIKKMGEIPEQSIYSMEWNKKAVLTQVHNRRVCQGQPCTIHNRTEHALRGWMQHWRSDRRIMERISPFGCGCPDPDEYDPDKVHGCTLNPFTKSGGVCEPWEICGSPAAWITATLAITQDGNVWSFCHTPGGKPDYDMIPRMIQQEYPESCRNMFLLNEAYDNDEAYGDEDVNRLAFVDLTMLKVWRGEQPEGYIPVHIDGDLLDDRLENLI